jgi:hypothetical protein
MLTGTFTARYAAAMSERGGRCAIEAGLLGGLADHECRQGRLALDRTPVGGCWPEESAAILALPRRHARSTFQPSGRMTHQPQQRSSLCVT